MTDERFLTVEELLAKWNIDARTLDKLIKVGGLGYVDWTVCGVRVRRFPPRVVEDFEKLHFRQSTSQHHSA